MQNANSASISAAKSRSVSEGMDVIANPRGFSSAIVDIADVILLTDLDYPSINRRPNSLHYTRPLVFLALQLGTSGVRIDQVRRQSFPLFVYTLAPPPWVSPSEVYFFKMEVGEPHVGYFPPEGSAQNYEKSLY